MLTTDGGVLIMRYIGAIKVVEKHGFALIGSARLETDVDRLQDFNTKAFAFSNVVHNDGTFHIGRLTVWEVVPLSC